MPMCSLNCHLIVMFISCSRALIVIRIYSNSYVARKPYAYAFARMYTHKSATPFLGSCRICASVSEDHVISHHSKCFFSTCASMVIHSFTVFSGLSLQSRHSQILYAPLQLTRRDLSLAVLAPAHHLGSGYVRLVILRL